MRYSYVETDSSIGIPYGAEKHPHGRHNMGYFDLKRKPELITTVPELQGIPELLSFVNELNHPRSLFRSLACEHSMAEHPDHRGVFKMTSFVRACFEILNWNSAKNYTQLYEHFELYVAEHVVLPSDATVVDFERDFASYNEHDYRAYALTIWHTGWGERETEAREHWVSGVCFTEEFFTVQRSLFQNELDREGLVTIS